MFADPGPQNTPTTKQHTNKNPEGTFADRHALWDIKKALLTNPPSSTNKSHWFPNNTSPWMHSPTSSAQPHTSAINNLHNKRPLCAKSLQFRHYCHDIQCWNNILAADSYIYDAARHRYWNLYGRAVVFIRGFSADEGHLGKNTQLLAFHIPVSFNSFAHGMKGEECLAIQ